MGHLSGGDILGTISPAYGAASGKGIFGHLMTSLFGKEKAKEGATPSTQAPQDMSAPDAQAPSNSSDPSYLNDLLARLGVYGHSNTVGPR